MTAYFTKVIRALAAHGHLAGLQVFIDSYCVVILVQIILNAKTHLLQQVVYVKHLYTRGVKDLFPTFYHLFGAVIIYVSEYWW